MQVINAKLHQTVRTHEVTFALIPQSLILEQKEFQAIPFVFFPQIFATPKYYIALWNISTINNNNNTNKQQQN